MKDFHVVYVLTKLELGGAQKICLKLLKGLREQGVGTSLISGKEGALVDEVNNFDNVYLIDSFKREINFSGLFSEFKTFFKMISLLRKLKKQHSNLVIHTHSTKAGLLGRFAALFAGVKTRVHTVHGFGFNDFQPWLKWLLLYMIEFVSSFITTHYVCVSQADLDEGSRRIWRFKKKSSIIRAAVDWDTFYIPALKSKSFGKNKDNFVFGSVSCFKPQKNLLDLIDAFKIVCDRSFKIKPLLQIVGDGEMREEIERRIKQHGIEDRVDLLGWQGDVASWMKSWDAYVMSSLWEGLPCSIVEARLLKLPVVAYSVGGISEVINNNLNGYLIKPKDINDLAKKMFLLLNDPTLHNRLITCPEDLSEFSDKFMIRKHFDFYNSLF